MGPASPMKRRSDKPFPQSLSWFVVSTLEDCISVLASHTGPLLVYKVM